MEAGSVNMTHGSWTDSPTQFQVSTDGRFASSQRLTSDGIRRPPLKTVDLSCA